MQEESTFLENFTVFPPTEKTIRGITYNIIAERYCGYGIFVFVHITDGGKLGVMRWQDYHDDSTEPEHYQLTATKIE